MKMLVILLVIPFGLSGLSMIFWVAVIAIWHADMLPKVFNDPVTSEALKEIPTKGHQGESPLIEKGAIRPSIQISSLSNRGHYSRKSLVIANFSPAEPEYRVNRLYTVILISTGVMSFIIITYGLQSGLNLAI